MLRYRREDMEAVVRSVNDTGFGLTFGVHSRIDETIDRATAASAAGNQYVNRNMIGAVVGVQPFGGHGLSGTGPKAGGPLYVQRLLSQRPPFEAPSGELAGPVGERNTYAPPAQGRRSSASPAIRSVSRRSTSSCTPPAIASRSIEADKDIAAVLFAGSADELLALSRRLAERRGPIVPVHLEPYPREFLFDEVSLSVNTAAAGGNASLMAIG